MNDNKDKRGERIFFPLTRQPSSKGEGTLPRAFMAHRTTHKLQRTPIKNNKQKNARLPNERTLAGKKPARRTACSLQAPNVPQPWAVNTHTHIYIYFEVYGTEITKKNDPSTLLSFGFRDEPAGEDANRDPPFRAALPKLKWSPRCRPQAPIPSAQA